MGRTDRQFLERHGGRWRVAVAVPRKLQERVGATKLKQSLKTDSLAAANVLKWPVVAALKAEIERAKRGVSPGDVKAKALLTEALDMREALQQERHSGQDGGFTVADAIELRGDQLRGDPIGTDEDDSPLYNAKRETAAGLFVQVANGWATPLNAKLGDWHGQDVSRTTRTKADDQRALGYLETWCRDNHFAPTIEAITRRVAGNFINDLPTISASAQRGHRLTNRTANKYISCLSAYWKWLRRRGLVEDNVWMGQSLPKVRVEPADRERPFTDDEIARLMAGTPSQRDLMPIMRIAALSGARLDAVASLRPKDCEGGVFKFKRQKREDRDRAVPIHSTLVPLVAELIRGKADDDDLFLSCPVPRAGSQKERSHAIVAAFRRYRESVGVDDRRPGRRRSLVNFHSFRRWFITKAEQAGIPESTIASVVGHRRQGMTFGVYSAGPQLDQFCACVEAVKLPS